MKFLKALVIIFTGYALFWNLGAKPLAEWDESRYGHIALEMLRGGDPINYYYNGEPEFWTAKPPFDVWSIVASYKVFGFNEFAMRLPATLAGIVALYFLFQFLSLYLTEFYTWAAIAVAVTTKALIGPHISRSADTDAFLVAGLFGFLFYFARFFQEGRDWDLVKGGVALGLAFFAKAFAIGFFFPAGVFFLVWKSGWKKLVRNKYFYLGAALFILVPAIWFTLVTKFGNKDPTNQFGGNAIEVMILFDVVGRLTGAIDSGRAGIDWGFLPRAMEIRFGVWWILLCFFAVAGVAKKFRFVSTGTTVFRSEEARRESSFLAFTCFVSLMILFFVSVVKLDWYLAPLLPFFCILFLLGYEFVSKINSKFTNGLALAALVVAISNQVRYVSLDETDSPFRDFVEAHKSQLEEAKTITPSRRLRQDEMLYVAWKHRNPIAPHVTQDNVSQLTLECREGDCRLLAP